MPAEGYNRYHEPFLGGGSVYFALDPPGPAFLSDLNSDLIETYELVRDDPQGVLEHLAGHRNSAEFYYEIRSQRFTDPVQRAARFIYLNQASFNGIYRVNLKGEYNVPFGYRRKNIVDRPAVLQASERLRQVDLAVGDFELIRQRLRRGDLVFLDPPYTVSHNDNGFIKYNHKLFTLDDQRRLARLIDEISAVGAHYVLTNAAHQTIAEIFERGDRRLELGRSSVVGGSKARRGRTSEYVFTNVRPHGLV